MMMARRLAKLCFVHVLLPAVHAHVHLTLSFKRKSYVSDSTCKRFRPRGALRERTHTHTRLTVHAQTMQMHCVHVHNYEDSISMRDSHLKSMRARALLVYTYFCWLLHGCIVWVNLRLLVTLYGVMQVLGFVQRVTCITVFLTCLRFIWLTSVTIALLQVTRCN